MRHLLLPILALAVLLSGCSQAQIDRAAKATAEADARLAQVDQAIAAAKQAIADGKVLADQIGNVKAQQIVAQAEAGLAAAAAARQGIQVADDAAHAALDAAKNSGGSLFAIVSAVVVTLVPAMGVILPLVGQVAKWRQGLTQTVAGIEEAKKTMSPEQISNLHGALAEAQDDHVKAAVSLVKAKL